MNNKKKFEIFLEVAGELNKSFNQIPTLFGSLGLTRAIEWNGEVQDIDFLLPKNFFQDKWQSLISSMESLGFKLIDENEHEFSRDKGIAAFGEEDELNELAQVDPKDLKIIEADGVKFRELSAQQYLNVYKTFINQPHRLEKREKDQEKIKQIQTFLNKD